jgi:cytochrome c-type biogenesis protein CcmF
MSVGEVLLIITALSALAAGISGALGLRRDDERIERVSRYASLLAFLAITGAFIFLAFLFLTSDLSYSYIWSHSSTGLDPFYKLVGVWAGGEGGLVLWTWFMASFLAFEVLIDRKRALSPKFSAAFRTAASSIVLLFALILLAAGLFSATSDTELLLHPDGLGMNIALHTVEMAVHPPLVFAAYAACLMVFAACLARFVSDDNGWTVVSIPWARMAGVLLLAGIAVGAVWAYYELGWGGFWVWDPVETASLLPFIAIIAFLHARRSQGAREGALMPFLGMLSFVFVLLASFITRTGGLWGSSVHTYGSAVSGSIGARFITVLTEDMSMMGLFFVIVVLFALSLLLAYRTMTRVGERGRVDNGTLLTVALLLIYAALLLLMLVKNNSLGQGENFIELTEKTTLLSFVIALVLLFGLLVGRLGARKSGYICAAVGIIGVGLAAVSAVTGLLPWLTALIILPALAVIGASVHRSASLNEKGAIRWLARAGGNAVHLGIALILISFIVSATMQAYLPDGPEEMSVGEHIIVGDRTVRLVELSTRPWTTPEGEPGEERIATFQVYSGGEPVTLTVSNYYLNDPSGPVLVRPGTAILNGLVEDVYLSYEWVDDSTASVEARVIPMVSEVWAGFIIATLGMAVTLLNRDREMTADSIKP